MLKILYARIKQKFRTSSFPKKPPTLPPRFRGLPVIERIEDINRCPTNALSLKKGKPELDLGKCLFCAKCLAGKLSFSQDYRLSVNKREDLVLNHETFKLATALKGKIGKLFGRSLKLRQVSAGGCNGCELDTLVLNTLFFDLGRFGIQFVASPRHADGILITGPVTNNMKLALQKTYEAVANPKLVIAVGACAISGGPYVDHSEVNNGADKLLPIDLFIPGCPPHPLTILDGLLRLIGKIK